jgi:spore coat protein CotH
MKSGRSYGVKMLVLMCGIGVLLTAAACVAVKDTGKKLLRGHFNPEKLDTGLPVITINTHNSQPVTSKEVYLVADIEISDPDDSSHNLKDEAEIRGRGNTTWNAPKKPYRIRFPKKTSLFGYEKARNWVLLANYQDTTLMTNTIAFELGRRFGLPFTPHYTHVEVILNGRYEGSYVLTEHIQTGSGRVDINEDGGFLVELDGHYDEEPKFRTPRLDLPVMIKHPEDLEDSGYDFVKKAVNDLEAAMFSDTFPDIHYQDLIDLDTFVDYIMINEITRNWDLQLPNSVYLYRDKDSRMGLGPLWDFDYGFDYTSGKYFTKSTGMFYNTAFHEGAGQKFFSRFFEDPAFKTAYRERWNTIYPELVSMELFIDQMAARLEKSHEANDTVWWWNKVDYPKEITLLKEWWKNRISYLHKEINTF